jgi:hypothetical protein
MLSPMTSRDEARNGGPGDQAPWETAAAGAAPAPGAGKGGETNPRQRLRAADSDRERAIERLRTALDEGRLTLHEFDERLADAWASRTFADLDRLVEDLPPPVPAERSQLAPRATPALPVPPSRHEENPKLAGWLAFLWRLWFVVVFINVVIWFIVSVAAGGFVYPWPLWVAGPWAAVNIALVILFPPRRPQ